MMIAKPKPSGEESPVEMSAPAETSTTDDREAEIARRLALLGDIGVEEPKEEEVKAPSPTPFPASDEVAILPVEPTLVMEDKKVEIPAPAPVPAPAAPVPVMEAKPTPAATPAAPAAAKTNKSALLARIMAAQDRAKQAQLKQASQQNAAPEPISMQVEKDKMMRALTGITTAEKKPDPLPPMAMAPPAPVMKAAQPPPPSFDIFEKQMLQQPNVPVAPAPVFIAPAPMAPPMMAPPPPAFDDVAEQVFQQNNMTSAPAMSAPDADLLGGDFQGIMPMAPPPVSAPSFDQVMQHELHQPDPQTNTTSDDSGFTFELDESGMQLSPEERKRMVEEQRAIMEHIEREARNNKASEAAIRADAFASRMSGPGNMNVTPVPAPVNTAETKTNVSGFSASEIEEQRRILQEIEQAKRTTPSIPAQVGGGQTVPREFMTKEEIMQMEEDQKLAEALQAEENAAAGETLRTTSHGLASSSTKGWMETISDAIASVGGTAEPSETGWRSAEINVGQRNMTPSQRTLHSAVTGDEGSEHVGLLGGGGDGGRPAARVAQSQPLFSCVVDSISNTAAAAGSYLTGEEEDEVHGVDTTSFLAVPNAGRDKNDGGGNYFAIPPNE